MSLFSRWFGSRPALDPAQATRLARWQDLLGSDLHTTLANMRCVVVDVETSGLDPKRDSLIAIGAVAVERGQIQLGDAFEVILRQANPSSHANILVHGIGDSAQAAGDEPAEALLAFLEFIGAAPLVAFHVFFDETAIRRAMRLHLGLDFERPWLDLAYLAPALHPELAAQLKALDDWTAHFGIGNFSRHNALADAYATAQLLLVLLKKTAPGKPTPSLAGLIRQEKAQRALLKLRP